jgi:hypothetical protein
MVGWECAPSFVCVCVCVCVFLVVVSGGGGGRMSTRAYATRARQDGPKSPGCKKTVTAVVVRLKTQLQLQFQLQSRTDLAEPAHGLLAGRLID